MLADPEMEVGYVRVHDRYGDYGICGLYSRSSGGDELVDFLFSCRVLHMGVEQWLYEHLGRPTLSVVGEVASWLEGRFDWITLDTGAFEPGGDDPDPASSGSSLSPQPNRILMVGSCDLASTAQYLGGEIVLELDYPGPAGTIVHVGHTETIRQSRTGLSSEQLAVVAGLPMVTPAVFHSSAVTSSDYDVLVLSLLTDYTQGLYRHRELGFVLPWHQFEVDVTDPVTWPALETRFAREGTDRAFLEQFARNFEFEGVISDERFEANLRWLAGAVPDGARIVFVNGAEVPFDKPRDRAPSAPPAYERHSRPGGGGSAQCDGVRCAHLSHQQ